MKTKIKNRSLPVLPFLLMLMMFLTNIIAQNNTLILKSKKTVRIAIIKEGPSERDNIIDDIKPELLHMLGNDYDVVFDESKMYNADWNIEMVRSSLVAAIEDDEIDIILGIGRTIAQEALKDDIIFNKPFVCASLLNGLIPYVPLKKGYVIEKENVNLIILPHTFDDDIHKFSTMGDFDTVYVGLDEFEYNYIENKQRFLNQLSEYYNIHLKAFPLPHNLKNAMAAIDTTIKAYYLVDLPRMSDSNRKNFITYLNSKNIYTFSNQGPSDLNLGALATNKPEIRQEVNRRLALNLFHLIKGVPTEELKVLIQIDPKFTINARTGMEVGFNPSFSHKVEANFINFDAFDANAQVLNIPQLLKQVDENNTSLRISKYQSEAKEKDEKIVRSGILPQVGIGASYEKTHNRNLNGLIPDEQTVLGVSVNQMIYDDELVSGFRASKRISEAANYKKETDRLDLFYQAEQVYFAYSQARIILKITMDNLRVTEGNLDLAKMRVAVGQSGKDEVYRWQVELANRRADVLNAEASLQAQRIALNQLLGTEQDLSWKPENIIVDENYLYEAYELLPIIFDSPDLFEKFRIVSVELAKEKSPEINLIKQNIEAQEILIGQKNRSFVLPKFWASFEYGHIFSQSDAAILLPKDNNSLTLSAYLPIFEGTRKIYSTQKEKIILSELNQRMQLASELVEQRTRTALRLLESSFPNLRFSREAAENARKNLDVIRDKYANGIVYITQLLDAQNASFRAEQNAAIAKFKFLSDMVELQRAAGIFYDDLTVNEQLELEKSIREKMNINN